MINAVRAAVLLAAVGLTACGGGPQSGTISGKVTFADGSEANGLSVLLLGPVGKRVETAAGGAYSFDKLPQGVYLVSVEAGDSREGKLSFGTESDGAKMISVPDLVFHAVGTLTGKVNNAAGAVAGATVYLSGSDKVAFTDSMGSYTFSDVPAGEYALVAKSSGALPQTATADKVKVKRGKNEAMPLVLANDLGFTGKLEGRVALFNGSSPKDVKVSVADVVAMTDDNGFFSMTLPPGDYAPLAELAGYPKQSLGLATVRGGFTTTLPVKTLSLFKAFPWESRINSASFAAVSESDTVVMTVSVSTDYSTEQYFLNAATLERRLFFLGFGSSVTLSKNGKWGAYVPSSARGVVAVNSVTGQTHSIGSGFVSAGPVISNDESTLMFYVGAPQNQLVRLDLNTGTVTTFPAFSGSMFQTNERFLATSTNLAPFDVQLITPTSATTVFNNMQSLVGTAYTSITGNLTGPQVAYAYTCAAACSVQVLGAAAPNSSQVTAVIPLAPFAISGSVKDWLGLQWNGITPGRILVKVSDGTNTTLPATAYQLLFNETLARVVTYSTGGLGYDVREDVVPPNPTSTVHFTTPTPPNGAWLSPARFMVFGTGPTKRLEIKAGVPATGDPDVTIDATMQSPLFFPPGVLWVKASTMKRQAAVYDSPTDLLPEVLGSNSSGGLSGLGARTAVLTPTLGKFAAFSDSTSLFVLDGDKNEVRKVGAGTLGTNSSPFVSTDRLKVSRNAGTALLFYASSRVTSLSEPGLTLSSNGVASLPKGGSLTVSVMGAEPRNVLSLAFTP